MRHIQKTRRVVARQIRRILHWWHRQDARYKWYWRTGNILLALLVVSGIVLPILNNLITDNRYELTPTAHELVGTTDSRLSKQLSWDDKSQSWQFNASGLSATANLPGGAGAASAVAAMRAQTGTPSGQGEDTPTYSLTLPKDLSKGVTYTDVNTGLSFSLVPEFKSWPGRIVDGHIVYPLEHGLQAIYTLKHNGLKEDIYIPKPSEYQTYSMNLYYKTKLPKTLELKKIPNGDGALGLYSADPTLFGNVSTSSDKDSDNLQKARETGEKTNLVFGLPAPVVVAPKGQSTKNALGRFEVFQDQLLVIADNLHNVTTPVSLDPSVVVTSSSDFQTQGNNEGMIDFGTSGQITRGGLTGGSVSNGWTATTSFTGVRRYFGSAAYNGYLYVLGGTSGTSLSDVQYAPINSDGTIGTWTATTSLPSACNGMQTVVYSGYLYLLGGDCGGRTNAVQYAPVNTDGTLGSWSTTTGFTTARDQFGATASNDFMYIFGGYDGTNNLSDVQYAPINANGTVGNWTATTSLTSARRQFGYATYNGYLYVLGGFTNTRINTVQYAVLNSDGTVGSWMTATSLTDNRALLRAAVYNGYLYVFGGNVGGTSVNTVQYALVNANGSLGSWQMTAGFTTARNAHGAAAYNGYLYIFGGLDNTPISLSDMQYAKIDPAGQPTAFGTLTNNFTTAKGLSCAVAYNGYLYNIGGSTSSGSGHNVTTVQYTALDGTGNDGSWSSTTALPTATGSSGCAAYNGYLYVLGGYTGTGGSGTASSAVLYNTINSNGTLGASWTTSGNSLPNSYPARPAAFTYGTSGGAYLYVLGACDASGTTICDDTNYASLNASTGAVGTWTTSGNAMVNQYTGRGYAQVGKYLYAFAGQAGGTNYVATEYTSINNNGTINAWASTTGMGIAIAYTGGTAVNGCIYSLGGETGAGARMNNVQYACPNADGTISAWYNAPNLTVATTDLGVTSYNGYLYGVGGYTTSVQTTTQYAFVNNGGSGSNGAWATATNDLAASRFYHASVAYNGYLYAVGGTDGSSDNNNVQYSQMDTTGNTGTFTTDSHTFTNARNSLAAAAYNGYLYVLGGYSGGSTYGDTQYAPIGGSGALSGNFASTTSFVTGTGSDTGRQGLCAVAYNGYLYAVGGVDTSSRHADTRYAPINGNGTLGAWADSGNNFTTARAYHNCFVANGYLYVLGGGTGSANLNDVQYAPINSNGTLGAWTYTSSFSGVRETAIAGYSNGFVYISAGCSNTACNTYLGDTQFAPVNANGALGAWQRSTSSIDGSTGVVGEVSGVAYNGYLYSLGGNGSGTRSSVYYAPLNAISRTARYSKLIDLGVPTNISSITYNGTLPTSSATPGVVPISFRSAGNDGVFGSLTSSSAITPGATSCLATNQNYKRYLLVTITLDDTNSAIFADASGTLANITDFTVNYTPVHPPPNIRLRHGQTLQQGNLSALDTCTP